MHTVVKQLNQCTFKSLANLFLTIHNRKICVNPVYQFRHNNDLWKIVSLANAYLCNSLTN